MLTQDELRTICAALQFWEEEICPHPSADLAGYFPVGQNVPLTGRQLREVRRRLASCELRHGVRTAPLVSNMIRILTDEETTQERPQQRIALLIPSATL